MRLPAPFNLVENLDRIIPQNPTVAVWPASGNFNVTLKWLQSDVRTAYLLDRDDAHLLASFLFSYYRIQDADEYDYQEKYCLAAAQTYEIWKKIMKHTTYVDIDDGKRLMLNIINPKGNFSYFFFDSEAYNTSIIRDVLVTPFGTTSTDLRNLVGKKIEKVIEFNPNNLSINYADPLLLKVEKNCISGIFLREPSIFLHFLQKYFKKEKNCLGVYFTCSHTKETPLINLEHARDVSMHWIYVHKPKNRKDMIGILEKELFEPSLTLSRMANDSFICVYDLHDAIKIETQTKFDGLAKSILEKIYKQPEDFMRDFELSCGEYFKYVNKVITDNRVSYIASNKILELKA